MTSALESFRNPPIETRDIANITGDPSDCGIPDVQGNIGYFNNLCTPLINGTPAGTSSSSIIYAKIEDMETQYPETGSLNPDIGDSNWYLRKWTSLPEEWTPLTEHFNYSQEGLQVKESGWYHLVAYFQYQPFWTGTSYWNLYVEFGAGPNGDCYSIDTVFTFPRETIEPDWLSTYYTKAYTCTLWFEENDVVNIGIAWSYWPRAISYSALTMIKLGSENNEPALSTTPNIPRHPRQS